MQFALKRTIELLSATPSVIKSLLGGLSAEWIGGGTPESWGPNEIVGHLIRCEEADWVPRARFILEQGESLPFPSLDRLAQFANSKNIQLSELINAFAAARSENIRTVRSWGITDQLLAKTGIHPEFGRVTMQQMLATWAVHDLTHIRQLSTVIAKKYEQEVGPWREYLSILK